MEQTELIASWERRAAKVGASIRAVCEMADVHPTSFSRWKVSERNPDPVSPSFAAMRKIDAALSKLERAA